MCAACIHIHGLTYTVPYLAVHTITTERLSHQIKDELSPAQNAASVLQCYIKVVVIHASNNLRYSPFLATTSHHLVISA
jgi:hypothetical protein